MGFSLKKSIKAVRNTVKKAAAPVTRITEKVLKPVVTPLRPIASKLAPIINPLTLVNPALGFTGGLTLRAKAFGIKSERGVAGYRRTQKVARIGTAAAAVVVGGYYAAPALASAATKAAPFLFKGAGSVATSVLPGLLNRGGGGPTEDTAWNPETGYDGGGGGGGGGEFAPDPAEYAPSPAWPARPDGAAAPTNLSPVLALVGAGVGLYLLVKGG
jgi:hypothetical protein